MKGREFEFVSMIDFKLSKKNVDAEAEAPILWPPDGNTWASDSLEKTLMLGKIGGRRRRG